MFSDVFNRPNIPQSKSVFPVAKGLKKVLFFGIIYLFHVFPGVLTSGFVEGQGYFYANPYSSNRMYPSPDLQLLMLPMLYGGHSDIYNQMMKKFNLAADVS